MLSIRRDVRLSLPIIFDWSGINFVNDVLLKNDSYIFETIVFFLFLNMHLIAVTALSPCKKAKTNKENSQIGIN